MALKVCAESGCPTLVERGQTRCPRCEAVHLEKKGRAYDAGRPAPAERGYDERHRAWREKILKRDPVCKTCRVNPSRVADHIVPIGEGGSRFSMSNGQGQCNTCHNVKRQEESVRARQRNRGR